VVKAVVVAAACSVGVRSSVPMAEVAEVVEVEGVVEGEEEEEAVVVEEEEEEEAVVVEEEVDWLLI
jgi:hypothetical protein